MANCLLKVGENYSLELGVGLKCLVITYCGGRTYPLKWKCVFLLIGLAYIEMKLHS